MRVFDETKTTELTSYDLDRGYLKGDILRTIIPAVEAVQEVGHKEVIRTYPNGGRDLRWVVDIPGVKAQPEKTEEEAILVYIPYTEAELTEREKARIKRESVASLLSSDYRILKIFEAIVKSNPEYLKVAEAMYPGEVTKRDGYRDDYNSVEET